MLLSVRNLRTHFCTEAGLVRAVENVSFDVAAGEIVGIVGESGSGKTILGLSMLRLLPKPSAFHAGGEILFEGKDLVRVSEEEARRLRGRRIAMVFQDPMTALNPYLTVGRQLAEVLEEHEKCSRSAALKRAGEAMERVGITEAGRRLQQYPHELSGGMRQRVVIAMALLGKPSLLIADEPTTALDVTVQAQILDLLDQLRKELNAGILLVTHDFGVVARMADRVLLMYAGRIVEEGETQDLFDAPRHPYTEALLKSVPRLDAEVGGVLPALPGMPPDLSNLPRGCAFHPRCPKAGPKCREKTPEAVVLGEGRWAACWEVGRP